jgi:hypothetical protein
MRDQRAYTYLGVGIALNVLLKHDLQQALPSTPISKSLVNRSYPASSQHSMLYRWSHSLHTAPTSLVAHSLGQPQHLHTQSVIGSALGYGVYLSSSTKMREYILEWVYCLPGFGIFSWWITCACGWLRKSFWARVEVLLGTKCEFGFSWPSDVLIRLAVFL